MRCRLSVDEDCVEDSRAVVLLTICAVLAGLLLRGLSYRWNSRLQGDVNLFALTAREYRSHGRLFYPMKYEYSDYVDYAEIATPASQHPPLWSLAAGVVAKVVDTGDTFAVLKVMCEAASLILLVTVLIFGRSDECGGWVYPALCGLLLSPMLADFSANGSPYILLAVFVVLAGFLFVRLDPSRIISYMYLGVVCALGLLVHSAMVCLPMAVAALTLIRYRKFRILGLISFSVVFAMALLPWAIWTYMHFGTPLYSYSSYHILKQLGAAEITLSGKIITTQATDQSVWITLHNYASLVWRLLVVFPMRFVVEMGPFWAGLAAIGVVQGLRERARDTVKFLLPSLCYCIVIVGWATYRERFLVPVLPTGYVLGGYGISVILRARRRAASILAFVWLCCALVLSLRGFLDRPPTTYYAGDSEYAEQYSSMRTLVEQLQELQPGTILGCSHLLDGGMETAYWLGWPYVYGRELGDDEIRKAVADFDIDYVWVDVDRLARIRSILPNAVVVLENGPFYVLRILDSDSSDTCLSRDLRCIRLGDYNNSVSVSWATIGDCSFTDDRTISAQKLSFSV